MGAGRAAAAPASAGAARQGSRKPPVQCSARIKNAARAASMGMGARGIGTAIIVGAAVLL